MRAPNTSLGLHILVVTDPACIPQNESCQHHPCAQDALAVSPASRLPTDLLVAEEALVLELSAPPPKVPRRDQVRRAFGSAIQSDAFTDKPETELPAQAPCQFVAARRVAPVAKLACPSRRTAGVQARYAVQGPGRH